MKKFTMVAAAVSIAGPALAADLGSRSRPAPVAPVVAPVASWQGFYFGGHIGGVSNTDQWRFDNLGAGVWGPVGGGVKFTKSSFAAGLQGGYNWQFGQFVTGLDVSATLSDAGHSGTSPFFPGTDRLGTRSTWVALAQARVGYAFGDLLIFGQGGIAVGDHKMSLSTTALGFNNDTKTSTRVGWTIGAGVNYMLTPNWVVGAEYSYVDFGNKRMTFSANGAPNDLISSKLTSHLGKLTVNYKF